MKRTFLLSSLIVATASGGAAAAYTLDRFGPGFIRDWLIWEEAIPIALGFMLFAAAPIAALIAGVALVMRRLRIQKARWLSQGPWISAGLLVVGSLLLLGPVGGFHHMIRFGLLGYMILDCDSPPEELPIPFGRCGIRGSPVVLVVTLVLWVCLVLLLHRLTGKRPAVEGTDRAQGDNTR